MNFFDHTDLGNHLLHLCPKVVKHSVCMDCAILLTVSQVFVITLSYVPETSVGSLTHYY
jgi:hypothetical protein